MAFLSHLRKIPFLILARRRGKSPNLSIKAYTLSLVLKSKNWGRWTKLCKRKYMTCNACFKRTKSSFRLSCRSTSKRLQSSKLKFSSSKDSSLQWLTSKQTKSSWGKKKSYRLSSARSPSLWSKSRGRLTTKTEHPRKWTLLCRISTRHQSSSGSSGEVKVKWRVKSARISLTPKAWGNILQKIKVKPAKPISDKTSSSEESSSLKVWWSNRIRSGTDLRSNSIEREWTNRVRSND